MLKKDNIQLRPPEPEDVEFLLNLENNPSLWNISNTHNPFSRFDIEQYVLLFDKDIYSVKQLRLMIDCTEEGKTQTIGTIDIFDFDAHNKRAGIGITIIEKKRKKGYAGTALDILIKYMFTLLNLHQIYCNIGQDNVESFDLFKSRGFTEAGIKKDWNMKNNRWVDEHFFQLITPDIH
ncbi:MAG: GNAT family N-acetyltransferase [Bacteroidetes bacterium]|nr:GNAT family N-acetyltransferase [Bacteroidota bacterium]MBL6943646.1 GNAT family N-acetyltransferase [Bacteroidales bacterium]